MKKLTENAIFLQLKRQHRTELENRRKNKSHIKNDGKIKGYYKSEVLELLNNSTLESRISSKPYKTFNIPKNFSIIDNPYATLKKIREAATYSRVPTKIKGVSINHYTVTSIDLAAESIFDLTMMEMEKEIKSHNRKIQIKGSYPKDEYLQRFIRAVGIIKNLEVEHEFLTQDEEKDLKVFQMRNSRYYQKDNIDQADYKENTVTDFVDHINSCLIVNGRQLTQEARFRLADYTGEIISNAEDHTDMNDWSVVGYLDNNYEQHACEITIFNFGNTISSTLKDLPDDHYTKTIITPYIDLHESKGWFGESWDEDDLLTLMALQGDISQKNTNNEMDRGQGTVEMIEFFQKIHKECTKEDKSCARMAILSGKTHVLFDGTYSMTSSESRKVIAFNKDNDLNQRPDKKYVTNLGDISFPGTIISIRFPLQDTQTQKA